MCVNLPTFFKFSFNLMPVDSLPCFSTSRAEVDLVLASRLVNIPAVVMSDYATRSSALTGQLGTVCIPRLL